MEKLAHQLAHQRHPGRATDHHHFQHLFLFETRIAQGAATGQQGALDQRLDQLVKLAAGDRALPAGKGAGNGIGIGQAVLDGGGSVQQLALDTGIELTGQPGLLFEPVRQQVVEIIATEGRVTAGGHHLKHPAMQTQNGDVEGTATQVIDGDHPFLTGVEAIGDGGGGRFIEQTQHVQTGQSGRILGALTLGVIEIGGHCDHHAVKIAPQGGGAPLGQFFQDLGRNLHRVDQPLTGLQLRHAVVGRHEFVGLLAGIDVSQRLAHHPLGGDDGVVGIEGGLALGIEADPDGIGLVMHDGGQQITPLLVAEGVGLTAAHGGDQRVGGAKVDADGTLVLMRCGALAGLGDLQ